MFKEQTFIEIPFDQREYEDSITWAADTIKRIEAETEWSINSELIKAKDEGKYPPFYCMNLCSIRYHCPHKYEYIEMLKAMKEACEYENI